MMDAVKLAVAGAALLLAAAGAVGLGILPPGDLLDVAHRVLPILALVVAVTVVAELASTAGVFDVAAAWLARAARGRTVVLWLLVAGLAVIVTAFLSLDTTAVLLTPVVIAVARACGLPPLPFAFTTVWLANTASLALPVSNLTNLLAVDRMPDGGPLAFVALMGPSALVAVAVTVVLLFAIHRTSLRGRFVAAAVPPVADRTLFVGAAVVVVVLMPLLVSGIEPWIPATAAAVALVAVFGWRSPRSLSLRLLPWQLVVFAAGLFAAIAVLESLGSAALVAAVAGPPGAPGEEWRVAATALIAANAIDNLPAYLLLESAAPSPERLGALLIGVNAGPLITPWASLATLLWHDRLRAVGVEVPWRRFVLWGLLAAPLVVAAAVLPLALR